MFSINGNKMALDLTVVGYIRQGRVVCVEHKAQISTGKDRPDPLYGKEGNGQVCDTCGVHLVEALLGAIRSE